MQILIAYRLNTVHRGTNVILIESKNQLSPLILITSFVSNIKVRNCAPINYQNRNAFYYKISNITSFKIILQNTLEYRLVRSGVECQSGDAWLGRYDHEWECAYACHLRSDCNFFIFGSKIKGSKKEGYCHMERTESRECHEGWENDQFDFNELIST